MKPKTKLQHRVIALSNTIDQRLTVEQEKWAFTNCLEHWAYKTKSTISCMDCGHVWKPTTEVKTCTCPSCNTFLEIKETRKKNADQRTMVGMLIVVEDFQVNRFFEIKSYHKAGTKARKYIWEVTRQFMQPDLKSMVVVSRVRTLNYYMDTFGGDLEIRDSSPDRYTTFGKYNLFAKKIIPKPVVLPIYKRNGFKGKFGDLTPFELFTTIVRNQKAETLLKTKQMDLLWALVTHKHVTQVNKFWASVKIAIRNKYMVKDAEMWLDHLETLEFLGKDLHSASYVCPDNLIKEHNRAVAKRTAIEKRKEYEELRKEVEAEQIIYVQEKSKYFDLIFKQGGLNISVMTSVRQFMEEGDLLQHCVFRSKYHQKTSKLIFSAQVKGIPVETVDVSLQDFTISQSRGLKNGNSKYHAQIIELVKKNMPLIKKAHQERIKPKSKSKSIAQAA